MDVDAVTRALLADLAGGDPERAAQEKRYLKSDLVFLGHTMPALERVAKGVDVPAAALLPLVERLWAEGVHDLRAIAIALLERHAKAFGPDAVPLLERLLRDSRTWAYVDAIAANVVGSIALRHDLGAVLDRWAADGDFWMRRSAMLALLLPLRRGEGDLDRFLRYADAMLEEKEFFVRKAIGWILREIGKKRPEVVAAWLRPRVARCSGVTLREAVKRLDPADRDALLAEYRAR